MHFASDGVEPFNNWTLTIDEPTIADIGSYPTRIECSMLDNRQNLPGHIGNRFSNEFTLEIIDLQMTLPDITIGLDSELTFKGTYTLLPSTATIDPELFTFTLIEEASGRRQL